MPTAYDTMDDPALIALAAEEMGWDTKQHTLGQCYIYYDGKGHGHPRLPNPLLDANDRDEWEMHLWEKHGLRSALYLRNRHVDATCGPGDTWRCHEDCEHDGTEASIRRAKGRCAVIAGKRAIEAKGNG